MSDSVKSPDIVCLGEPLFELNQSEDDAPFRPGHGGDASNCAIAAARQGASVGIVSALGTDNFGQSFFNLWAAEGVDASAVKRDPGAPTGIYFVTHGPDGHVFSYRRAGSAASRMTPEELPAAYVRGARVLHTSGISQAISSPAADLVFAAIHAARGAGTLVSYDTNLRLRLWPIDRARAVIHAAAGLSDILKTSSDDAKELCGHTDPDRIADFYLGLGPKIVIVTLGGEGALVATPTNRARIAAIPVKPVDATGAGDTFDGAFLCEYLREGDPFAAARYANAAAGLATEGYGAVAPMPRRAAVEAALIERR
ncbi:sugar kinase [Kaistia dalseonensis]|uniref:2-dehydro-3-deoxygluconokinase n=1 Tax=Kaistia dalseonensis TaxID=410840 RepID=A0ABU0H692_9HYPH|nr:sugar kinase [Kaistia dalseonensis]MCX5495241.1 sugar kinase [Kaistia dalseonensis]MDQ0437827.1 2-dehydro-3-deoxygluconokinase [Kaistia dalseonensis]